MMFVFSKIIDEIFSVLLSKIIKHTTSKCVLHFIGYYRITYIFETNTILVSFATLEVEYSPSLKKEVDIAK